MKTTKEPMHPALGNAPKSLRESLERALAFLKANNGGACRYLLESGKTCVIGNFFTPAQRIWIDKIGANTDSIFTLAARRVGTDNVKAMTGMNLLQCRVLQERFDKGKDTSALRSEIQSILDGKYRSLKNSLVPFNL